MTVGRSLLITVSCTIACLASIAAIFAAVSVYSDDRVSRLPANRFASEYTMPLRRPEIVTSLGYAPSSDFAMDLVADATLRDALVPVNLNRMTPRARAAWIDAVPRYDEQMNDAAILLLDAIARRPGWPYHSTLLGQVVYERGARNLSSRLVTDYRRWSVPLYFGSRASRSDSVLRQSLALAYLQTWPDLGAVHARTAGDVFRTAFEDPDFVGNAFAQATQIIGTKSAVADLPDSPKPLWAAFEQLATSGQMDDAWRVHQRWDAAEWRQRQRDLAAIELAFSRGDIEKTRQLCRAWTTSHSVWSYDSPPAHEQAARVLDLWPASDEGRWPGDARSELIRYFLAGRQDSADGNILARASGAVSGIPAPTQAQLHVLAADIAGADAIARASDSFGSFEWKTYLLDLSRYWLRNGNREKAKAALAALPPAARAECEALAARAAVDGGDSNIGAPPVKLTWSSRADIALCLPKRTRVKLTLTLLDGSPAVIDYGWDRARSGSLLLSRSGESAEVILPSAEGMRIVSVRAPFQQPDTSLSIEVNPVS